MATVIFADSRGAHLAAEIQRICNENVTVCYYRGIGLERLANRIWTYTRSHNVGAAYILAGINNITFKDPLTGECHTGFETPGDLHACMMDMYMYLLHFCYANCGISHVVIPTLTGISLSRYNRSLAPQYGQWVINCGVWLINEDIITINAAHGYHTPCLHNVVHIVQHHPYRHRNMYNRLRDGLHPTRTTLTKWARSLVHSMRLNNHL